MTDSDSRMVIRDVESRNFPEPTGPSVQWLGISWKAILHSGLRILMGRAVCQTQILFWVNKSDRPLPAIQCSQSLSAMGGLYLVEAGALSSAKVLSADWPKRPGKRTRNNARQE